MTTLEVIKRGMKYADGFEYKEYDYGEFVEAIGIRINKTRFEYSENWTDVYFPLLLTRIIEGINREFFHNRCKFRIRQNQLGTQIFDGWGTMLISYGCSKSWEDAKLSAITYVLEQEGNDE